jgi:hypothetical protein
VFQLHFIAGMLMINVNSDNEIAYDSDMGATQRAKLLNIVLSGWVMDLQRQKSLH